MTPVQRLGRFRRDRRGLAAIEFAFIAPILILAYFGVAELCGAMLAQRKVSHVASAIGDLTGQYSSLQPSDITNFFAAGDAIMTPASTTGLKMRISVVQENAANTAATVLWSCATSNWTPLAAKSPVQLTPNLITANQSVVMSEAQYVYNSPVNYLLKSGVTYSNTFFLRPRIVDPIPAPTPGSC
jgi:Flp pilus assembly protein TadG